jgi:C-terminal processing protease CtpA/Prc
MYRSFREELKKLYTLNKLYIKQSPKFYELAKGPDAIIAPEDYDGESLRIFPAASPEAVSSTQRKEKANMLKQNAAATPGYDKALVERLWLEAHDYDEIDQLYNPEKFAPPPNPKVELEKAKLEQQGKEHQDDMQLEIANLQMEMQVNEAKISELQTKAELHLAQAGGVKTGHQIALIYAQIESSQARQKGLTEALDLMSRHHNTQMKLAMEKDNGNSGSGQKGVGSSSGDAGVPK